MKRPYGTGQLYEKSGSYCRDPAIAFEYPRVVRIVPCPVRDA